MKISGLALAVGLCCAASAMAQDSQRLSSVKTFADTVLDKAGDKYNHNVPLLANGVDPRTGKQMEWIFPDGKTAVLSNFSAQQNFMRVLVGLSNLTGDDKYRKRAEENVRYYFDHYQDKSGLLLWGGHRFVDLKRSSQKGRAKKKWSTS